MLQSREYESAFHGLYGLNRSHPRGRDGFYLQSLLRISSCSQIEPCRIEPLP